MHEIIFDGDNPNWSKDKNFNIMFLLAQERYLHDLLKARGYLYFNQIYEALGAIWNPEYANKCLRYNKKYFYQFQFEVFPKKNDSLRIIILTPDEES